MKRLNIALTTLALIAGLQSVTLAAPDTYIGDAAIYSALDTGSDRPKPHVLLLIDTSRSTLNKASGVRYIFDAANPYAGPYNPWNVYAANNQGNFSTLEIASSTASLEGITCSTDGGTLLRNTLLTSGTYSGSGSSTSPNLRGGECDTAPKGATYALGNYLNYLSASDGGGGGTVVQNRYTCTISTQVNKRLYTQTVTDGCTGTYEFIGTVPHEVGTDNDEPGMGTNWRNYWSQLSGGCVVQSGSICTATSTPPPLSPSIPATTPTWTSLDTANTTLTPTAAFVGDTQRAIIYNALAQVVDGARRAVSFAAMTYNPNNQGGKVVFPFSDLSNDTTFNDFKAALPGPGEFQGAQLITSLTNRPQAESLFDAGYYLGALYPTSGTIPSDAVFPLPGITARENIGSTMAGTYAASNRNQCGYNHVILITNGLSNGDNSPKLQPIVDADGDARGVDAEAVYGGGSHYLDDVAAYLNKQDGIITHTVLAFQSSDPLISGAANYGGGKFYNVYDAHSLAEALTKLLATIVLEADTSFVAPVVPASSTNRTISSNRVYLGLFKPQNNRPWLGNLKKYGVSSTLSLLDRSNAPTTDSAGDFLPNSKSYWGSNSSGQIMALDGLLTGSVTGDGGNVSAGGVGGSLVLNLKAGLALSTPKPAWETRNIYTNPSGSTTNYLGNAMNRFSPNNALITAASLGVDAANRDKLINFVAGADGYDADNNGNTTEIRDWPLGDILHSKPLIFSYSRFTSADEANCSVNKSLIFVGSNDGMLHAFKDCDGSEAWAFIPDNLLPNLKYLLESSHYYFSDAPPTAYVHDINNNSIIEPDLGDKVVLIFGQGRGGGRNTLDAAGSRGAYYALDVSKPIYNPSDSTSGPKLLWKVDSNTTNFGELGETWSPPRLAKVRIGTDLDSDRVIALVGAGYDNNEDLRFGSNMLFPDTTTTTTDTTMPTPDNGVASSTGSSAPLNPRGRGVYAIEIARLIKDANNKYQPNFDTSGSYVWSFVHTATNDMDYSIPSDLTLLDLDNNGFNDRIYVGDTGGRIWRFDVGSANTSDWTTSARLIFNANKVGGETNTGRKIFYKPTVAMLNGIPTLYFGTGDRNHPLNRAVVDRMFAVRDRGQVTTSQIDIDNLKDLTNNDLQGTSTGADTISNILADLETTDPTVAGYYGWYVDLNENPGEKVLASALVFNQQAFYTTYAPVPEAELDACQIGNLGLSRLYQLNYATAEAVFDYYDDNNNASTYASNLRARGGEGIGLQREDRIRNIGVGIPSGIVTLIDASGRVTLMISSSNRVGTYQAPSAKMMAPLYWIQY